MSSFPQSGKKEFLEASTSWKQNKIHAKHEKSSKRLYKKQSGVRRGEKTATNAVCTAVSKKGFVIKAGLAQTRLPYRGAHRSSGVHYAAWPCFPLLALH